MITETVSLRITLPPCAPDLTAWPVSPQNWAQGRGSDGFSGGSAPLEAGAAETASGEEGGQNTALTRRGLLVELLS
jgi:hypothetical protein